MKMIQILCVATGLKRCYRLPILILALVLLSTFTQAHDDLTALPDTIVRIKRGVVGVGTMQKTRRPPAILSGTGFVVADGRHVLTNAHNIPKELNKKKKEFFAVFVKGKKENAITDPSGITYAIPITHARKLMDKLGLKP